MNADGTNRQHRAGRYIQQPAGYRAFLPAPLPPDPPLDLGEPLRELLDADIAKIAGTYHAWRSDKNTGEYKDVPGFCKRATLDDIRKHGHVLTPGRYVGAEAQEDDGEPFDAKMRRLVVQLREQQAEAAELDAAIKANLEALGYDL